MVVQKNKSACNKLISESMLVISSIMGFYKCSIARSTSQDDIHQIMLCLHMLSRPNKTIFNIFTIKCRLATTNMLMLQSERDVENHRKHAPHTVDVDDTVKFSQLTSLPTLDIDLENTPELSLHQAVMGQLTARKTFGSNLLPGQSAKVTQLTGFSDPVYAEAYVHSNQYDIVLDVLIVNQTDDLLQNCTLELATLGDLKLVEKPQPCVLAPHDFCSIKAVVKVTSTENGVIFGNIVYDVSGAISDKNIIVLSDIRIDIMDYIVPNKCSDTDFRKMWAVFEWENKISVNTGISDIRKYLDHLLKYTHMKCLQPEKVLCGHCEFLSANLYARSIFGEDALVNLSIEKPLNNHKAPISGHIRVRAKSQGMALYLGEMINKAQKESSA